VALRGRQGEILRYNQAFADFLGYPLEEWSQVSREAYTHPDDWAISQEKSRALTSGEIPEYRIEKRSIRKDGAVVWGRLVVAGSAKMAANQPMVWRSWRTSPRANMRKTTAKSWRWRGGPPTSGL
jgi:PAS domain S-box-containing protein